MAKKSKKIGKCACCKGCGCRVCGAESGDVFCITVNGFPSDFPGYPYINGNYQARLTPFYLDGCTSPFFSLQAGELYYEHYAPLGFVPFVLYSCGPGTESLTVGWQFNYFTGFGSYIHAEYWYTVNRATPNADRDCGPPIAITFTMSSSDLSLHTPPTGSDPSRDFTPPTFSGATVTIEQGPCFVPTCPPGTVWDGTECVEPPVYACVYKEGLTEFPWTPIEPLGVRRFPAGTTSGDLAADGWVVVSGPFATPEEATPCDCPEGSPTVWACYGTLPVTAEYPLQCREFCAYNLPFGSATVYISSPVATYEECECPTKYRCDTTGCVPDPAGPYDNLVECTTTGHDPGTGGPVLAPCLAVGPIDGGGVGRPGMMAARVSLPTCKNLSEDPILSGQAADLGLTPVAWRVCSQGYGVRGKDQLADDPRTFICGCKPWPTGGCSSQCPAYLAIGQPEETS